MWKNLNIMSRYKTSCINKQDDNNFTVQEGYYRHKQIYSYYQDRDFMSF